MSLVVDASAAAGWLLPDERMPDGLMRAFETAEALTAPWLFWVELRNILLVSERRGRLPQESVEPFLAAVDELSLSFDTRPDGGVVMALARRRRLTAYDALYLELALRQSLPLATLDAGLASAARAEHVTVLGD